jgi:sec-independent protein translocase protein TatC
MALRFRNRNQAGGTEGTMTLVEHLAELRHRLIISILAIGAGGVVTFAFYGRVLRFFEHPLCQVLKNNCKLYVTSPLDPLSIRFKIAAYGGLVLALPIVLWQMWRFITPGLRPTEKRYSVPFVMASLVFFGFGGFIAWLTFPHALAWLTSIGGTTLHPIYTPQDYLRLIVILMAVFGAAFEFPVVLVFLEVARVITPATLRRWRRRTIVLITIFSAVATPSSDPFSMLALAGPMYLFYEGSILIGKLLRR